MKIEIVKLSAPRMTIKEFAEKHNLTMLVEEVDHEGSGKKYRARFKDYILSTGINEFGEGFGRVDAAIRNYAKRISKKSIRRSDDSHAPGIPVPELILWPRKNS